MAEVIGQPIAYGRTAELYAWGDEQVLKLFYDWFGLENIEKEARIGRAIHASGLPVPGVGKILIVNGRYGLVYERIHGESMFKACQRKPWKIPHFARRCAELHVAVHSCKIPADLPSQKEEFEKQIRQADVLPTDLRRQVLSKLAAMPDGQQLCHGDFWPGNVLLAADREVIIDWFHATRGNALADLARTTNLVLAFTGTSQVRRPFLTYGSTRTNRIENRLLQVFCRLVYPLYVEHYFKLCPGDRDEYRRWLAIVAAARLSDRIPELEKMLLAQVARNL